MKSVIMALPFLLLLGCAPAGQSSEVKTANESADRHASSPSVESQPQDAIGLEMFLGTWQSTGDAFGQPALSTMQWTRALEGRFIRLDYAINPPSENAGKSIFSGVAYYKMGDDGSMKAFWADTSGDLHPISATFASKTLTSIWGVEGEKLGKTRYALTDTGDIIITDWISRDGEFHQFNNNTFSRAVP